MPYVESQHRTKTIIVGTGKSSWGLGNKTIQKFFQNLLTNRCVPAIIREKQWGQMNNVTMHSVQQAAKLMGISEQRVRKLLAEGRIKGKRLGRDWVVLELHYDKKHKYPHTRRAEQ